jgi:hypothetical protein
LSIDGNEHCNDHDEYVQYKKHVHPYFLFLSCAGEGFLCPMENKGI